MKNEAWVMLNPGVSNCWYVVEVARSFEELWQKIIEQQRGAVHIAVWGEQEYDVPGERDRRQSLEL